MKERYNLTLNPKTVDKVDKLARLEGKSRSNFVDSYLCELVAASPLLKRSSEHEDINQVKLW